MVCDHVGDNMLLCHIGEVMVVIEKVVDEYDDRVYKMAKVVAVLSFGGVVYFVSGKTNS